MGLTARSRPSAIVPMKETRSRVLVGSLASFLLGAFAAAQAPCTNVVLPGVVTPDSAPVGSYFALTTVDPDGAGPLPANLIVGGDFGSDHVRLFDSTSNQWTSIGGGLADVVQQLQTMPNGDVVAAVGWGLFNGALELRRWDGTAWSQLNSSIVGTVHALHALPGGELLAGGSFTSIDGVAAENLAIWDGTSWAAFGGGVSGVGARVSEFATLPNGDLVVGGTFATAGGVVANNIARWDGASFAPLGAGLAPFPGPLSSGVDVTGLVPMANGELFVCGRFATAGAVFANNVAVWNGSSWSPLGAGLLDQTIYGGWLSSADLLPNGDIVVGAAMPFGGQFFGAVHRWDGTMWSQYGPHIGELGVQVRSMPGGVVAASTRIGRFDGTLWQPLDGSGATAAEVQAVVELPNGDVVVGGVITMLNGTAVSNVALWNGSSWSAMAGGTDARVRHLAVTPTGEVIATGDFTLAGGAPANRIARWDGTSWSPLGAGTPLACVVAVQPDGRVVVSGEFGAFGNIGGIAAVDVARWDGASWSPMGGGLPGSTYTYALHAAANGDVYASSYCSDPAVPGSAAALRIVRWDGTSWAAVGGTLNGLARDVQVVPGNGVVIGGKFTVAGGVAANRVARWTGSAWSGFGSGVAGDVQRIELLPDGDLVAFANQTTTPPTCQILRWNGSTWSPLVGGADGYLSDAAIGVDGGVLFAGAFTAVGGESSPHLAEIATTCPAAVTSLGTGCVGSGGLNQLAAATLPWTGATFVMEATGLAPISLIAIDGGFAPLGPLPLAGLGLPATAPGCTLDITPEYFQLALSTTGAFDYSWPIPNQPVFAGTSIFWQMVVFEVDAGFSFVETTSTNALQLTIGTF